MVTVSPLNNFNPDDGEISTLDEFNENEQSQKTVEVNNPPSNRNIAAFLALLGDGTAPEQDFRNNVAALEANVGSLSQNEVLQAVTAEEISKDRAALVDILGDDQFDDGKKDSLVNSFFTGNENRTELTNLVGHKELARPNENSSPESEGVRVNTVAIYDQINAYNKFKQDAKNAALARTDVGILTTIANIAETLIPFVDQTKAGRISAELKKRSGSEEAFGLPATMVVLGQSKREMSQMLRRMPIAERMKLIKQVVEVINSHEGPSLANSNAFQRADLLRVILEDGFFTDFDQAADNIVSALDGTILGGFFARVLRVGTRAGKIIASNRIRKIERDAVRSDVQPGSVAQALKDTNPEKAAAVHKLVTVSDEAAAASYGTTKTEAISNDNLLEIFDAAEQAVTAKGHKLGTSVVDDLDVDDSVAAFKSETDGTIFLFDQEKAAQRSKIITKIAEAVSPVSRTEMFQVQDLDDGLNIRAVFGNRDSGFASGKEALDMVEFMFRERGVSRDQLILMKRSEEGYVPVKKAEAPVSGVPTKDVDPEAGGLKPEGRVRFEAVDQDIEGGGDFLVGVDYKFKFTADELSEITPADVKRNFLERGKPLIDGKHGTLQRMLLDAHSVLHPVLTLGANRAVDAGFGLERELQVVAKKFAKGFSKLSAGRRDLVAKEIYKANEKSKAPTFAELKAIGATEQEVQLLADWKTAWDTVYWLENLDLSKTLRNAGFMRYVNKSGESALYARPVARAAALGQELRYLDTATGKVEVISGEAMKELYDSGGKMAKLKDDIVVDREAISFVKSSEKQGEDFLRGINDGDKVLNYREGYYSVRYKAPKFVEKVYLDRNGVPIESTAKAVATAENSKDAELLMQRLTGSTSEENKVVFRVRPSRQDGDGFNSNYGLANTQGRSAQRLRGERLEDASGSSTNPVQTNIQDPVEALGNSIKNISRRVSLRDYLESTKARFLKQYSNVLQKDQFGRPIMPNKRTEITTTGKEGADARTTYEYIRYLENGYVDALDVGTKAAFSLIADTLDGFGLTRAEKVARAIGEGSINRGIRSTAFNLYLALNPARQLLVQSHQAVRLLALNPKFMANPRGVTAQLTVLADNFLRNGKSTKAVLRAAGMTEAEGTLLAKQFKNSGLAAAVDANNIVRSSHARLADQNAFQKLKSAIGVVPKFTQRIGFDVGEMTNISTAWLAFRDMALKANKGKALSPAQLDKVTAEARNFTFNMNAAGDMPYNQNMLSSVFQFIQVPHKALLNNLTNRAIPRRIRAQTAVFDLVMFGVPVGTGSFLFQALDIEDEEVRNAINQGAEDVILNKVASLLFGGETDIDFSSLSPGDIHGMSEMMFNMVTTNLFDIITNSPGGQLFFGGNARVTNAVVDTARFMGLVKDGAEDVDNIMSVAKSFIDVSSGMSNGFKALYALEVGQRVNARNQVLDADVNAAEAVAQLFGLPTKTATKLRVVTRDLYLASKEHDDDVKKWFRNRLRVMASAGFSREEMLSLSRRDGEAWRVWGESNNRARQIIVSELTKLTKDSKLVLLRNMTKALGFMTPDKFREFVLNSPLTEEQKATLLKFNDDVARQKANEDR